MTADWTVMFIDMVSSTALKYKDEDFHKSVIRLYGIIQSVVLADRFLKFTGDGAMVAYNVDPDRPEQAPLRAIRNAARIIRNIDHLNYRFDTPFPIHIRVGIATGNTRRFKEGADDLIGSKVDLAARLCSEAKQDGMLVDYDTLFNAKLVTENGAVVRELEAGIRVAHCERRLVLKGVPVRPGERFWDLTVERFIDPPADDDSFSSGLVALYLDRKELKGDFSPAKLLECATPRSRFIVAGRTLLKWAEIDPNYLIDLAKRRDLELDFVIASDSALQYIDRDQLPTVKEDFKNALPKFRALMEGDRNGSPKHVRIYESDLLILDGIVCAELSFEFDDENGNKSSFSRHAALQDINAVTRKVTADSLAGRSQELADAKGAMLWVCTCPDGIRQENRPCTAHGLHRRTDVILKKAKLLSPRAIEIEHLLRGSGEGLASRNNHPRDYLQAMSPYLECIAESRFTDVPPPICVQMQISSRCSTWCTMCDHFEEGKRRKKEELPLEDWQQIFAGVAECGARTAIISGGEPFVRDDIAALLRAARRSGLRVGLLTNGVVDRRSEAETDQVFEAVAASADWVAVSVDGTESLDAKIRNLHVRNKSHTRAELLYQFCTGVQKKNPKVKFSATVTLQSDNILMDLDEACRFIKETLTIPQVNFKFATGAKDALTSPLVPRDYRLSAGDVASFVEKLRQSPLRFAHGNNLAYLLRVLDNGIYNVNDIADGAPLHSLYADAARANEGLRCFTPFLFSLIDIDGSVYPCCHLYRDNHPMDGKTRDYRKRHCMGDLKASGFDFASIWRGNRYAEERRALTTIDPRQEHFEPCGECTRHCQHNSMLTRIERLYSDTPEEVSQALQELGSGSDAVWF
jgi:class 3 adenylate cyclase/organic radical activating enzyme